MAARSGQTLFQFLPQRSLVNVFSCSHVLLLYCLFGFSFGRPRSPSVFFPDLRRLYSAMIMTRTSLFAYIWFDVSLPLIHFHSSLSRFRSSPCIEKRSPLLLGFYFVSLQKTPPLSGFVVRLTNFFLPPFSRLLPQRSSPA